MERDTYIFKVIVVGDASVGKTSLTLRYTQDYFSENYIVTIGVNFLKKTIQMDNMDIVLDIWDTGGQERFAYIRASYFKGAAGAIICYDITNKKSFDDLPKWLNEVDKYCEAVPMVLVGTKKDLKDQRQVSVEEGKAFAEAYGMKFFETSAKTGENVEELFNTLAKMMVESYL